MNKGLSEYDVYKVIRPLFGDVSYDQNNMPILNRADYSKINLDTLGIRGMQNMSVRNNNRNTLLTMFNYDKRLLSLWNSSLKKIPIFQTYAAVATPDFSLYPSMNYNEIRHNIFMSRWLGKTWQSYGCNVIPTVGWALPDTYDLCLGSIETGSVVIISTLGCSNYVNEFLNGFEEMKKRINPPIVIVVGDMLPGMTGTFINYKYVDGFVTTYEQLKFEGISNIFTIKEGN